MTKFYGVIGFAHNEMTAPGVWEDVMTEKSYFGDVTRNSRRIASNAVVNDDISVANVISIVADAFANENFFAMRYIKWAGTLWVISDIEVRSPRLILTLGGVYDGPKASTSSSA